MPRRTRPWKQGYRQLPPHLRARLETLPADATVQVACVRLVTLTDVAAGIWEHTGIMAEAGAVCVLAGFLPPRSMGRHSRWNIDGRTLALKDRPKVQVAYSWDSPNFGDYTKGSHTVWMDREVFQRETRYGKALRSQHRQWGRLPKLASASCSRLGSL